MKIELIPATDMTCLSECLRIRNAVFTLERKVPAEIEVDEQDVPGGDCEHFLIKRDGESVGACRCMHTESGIKLQRFCILKECRERGVGKAALTQLEQYYSRRQQSGFKMELDSKFEVCGFYEACGYRRESEVFMEAGIPHVKMGKEIVVRIS
ncbi:MAG: GNAT family N-acetyltransferase [Lachnospiraceae bacterium]|nr:GNAT family N-acetyltransferase [Lachnospiraceae bacterium]